MTMLPAPITACLQMRDAGKDGHFCADPDIVLYDNRIRRRQFRVPDDIVLVVFITNM